MYAVSAPAPYERWCGEWYPPWAATTSHSDTSSSVSAYMPGGYVSPLDIPTAPSARPAATSERIRSTSAGDAGRSDQPSTSARTLPCGTR